MTHQITKSERKSRNAAGKFVTVGFEAVIPYALNGAFKKAFPRTKFVPSMKRWLVAVPAEKKLDAWIDAMNAAEAEAAAKKRADRLAEEAAQKAPGAEVFAARRNEIISASPSALIAGNEISLAVDYSADLSAALRALGGRSDTPVKNWTVTGYSAEVADKIVDGLVALSARLR